MYNCAYKIGLIPGNKTLVWVLGTEQETWPLVFHSKRLRDFAGSVQWCNLFMSASASSGVREIPKSSCSVHNASFLRGVGIGTYLGW